MKLGKRGILAIILLVSLIMPSNIGNAAMVDCCEENQHNHEMSILINNDELDTKAIIVCDKSPSGNHECYSRGWGTLRVGTPSSYTQIFANKAAWQCKYCYHVIVTEGEVPLGEAIGYYGTANPGYETSMYGSVVYVSKANYTSSNSLTGYRFRYN